ncbi:CBS domain-containing protein [Ferruginibacter paludis]|jgi:CBS domain-containing protein|uniref:CBS domain-containing protein n=1 Tax=Ferruginibacter TaxID=1004303 RepID=UPI0025B2E044|nr:MULTISPECIES: CBS domain-containing protein [Ferruginibacter]MDB5278508.1 putative signal-transduction protein with domain [Ferruginibacter sp.]MDN3654478.1 CBS domain-containing protein [Ferruginibacter paludis]
MLKVADILKNKGKNVYSVTPDTSVYDALTIMGQKNIGALMVIEGEKLKGIFSERDYARKVVLVNRTSRETMISEIMTTNVITVSSSDSIDHCMELMSGKKIRHLPVSDNGSVAGLISISDVVTAIIESQKETISYLHNYISQ